MNEQNEPPNRGSEAGLNELRRFGSASESLFRRLYGGLNRRRQLEAELLQERAHS